MDEEVNFKITIDNYEGFYLSIVTGDDSCIAIAPIRVYYPSCEGFSHNLVSYRQSLPNPFPTTQYNNFGQCVENSVKCK